MLAPAGWKKGGAARPFPLKKLALELATQRRVGGDVYATGRALGTHAARPCSRGGGLSPASDCAGASGIGKRIGRRSWRSSTSGGGLVGGGGLVDGRLRTFIAPTLRRCAITSVAPLASMPSCERFRC